MSPGPDPVVVAIPPDTVQQVWPHVERFIRAASEHGPGAKIDMLRRGIFSGDFILWVIWDGKDLLGVVVHSIEATENDKLFCILACAGTGMRRWLHLLTKLEDYARGIGCTRMRMFGRTGWTRVLRDWTQTGVILDRVI